MTRAQFLDAIASPSPYPSQWVSESVIDSFKSGDSYRISELCKLGLKGTKVLTPRPSRLFSHCLNCYSNRLSVDLEFKLPSKSI